jgi:hypothetical protein
MVLSRQGSWPLILCGPMLRRVVPDLVSVFIALSSPAPVTLKVQTLADAARDTVALGKYRVLRDGYSIAPNRYLNYIAYMRYMDTIV